MIRLQKKEKNVNLKVKRSKKNPNAWTTHGLANGTGKFQTIFQRIIAEID
jgi:hypothetical protein